MYGHVWAKFIDDTFYICAFYICAFKIHSIGLMLTAFDIHNDMTFKVYQSNLCYRNTKQ